MHNICHAHSYEKFFEIAQDLLCIVGTDACIEAVNPAWHATLAWTSDELLGRDISEFVHPDDRKSYLQSYLAPKRPSHVQEVRFLQKNGGYLWFRYRVSFSSEELLYYVTLKDITESKRDRLLMEQTQAVAKIGAWDVDLCTEKVFWTPETHAIHETDAATFCPQLSSALSFYLPAHQPVIAKAFERLRTTGEGYDLVLRILSRTGRILWIRTIGKAQLIGHRVVKAYGTFQDISAGRLIEDKIVRNEALLSAFLDNVPALTYAKDLNGIYILSNCQHRLVAKRDDVIGKTDADFLPPDLLEACQRSDRQVLATGLPVESEEVLKGSEEEADRYFNTLKFPLLDPEGRSYAICGISRDVTADRRLEKKLRESIERFKQVTDNISEVIWMTDVIKSQMVYVSPAYERVWGSSRESLYNQPLSFLDAIHPDDRERVIANLPSQIAGDFEIEYRIIRSDGALRHIRDRSFPIKDCQGNPYRVVGIASDITKQKEAEALIASQQASIVAASKMSALGEMAGGIAHEINNPLAIIDRKALQIKSLIQRQPLDIDKIIDAAETLSLTTHRIAHIIRCLRAFARSAEQDPYTQVKVSDLIRDTLAFCLEKFKNYHIDLQVEISEGDLEIACRQTEISQVLINLLSNAFDAVCTAPIRHVRLASRMLPQAIEISVTDSGEKIACDIKNKMMQPFFTTKEIGKGTGLGLSISKSIVESHAGQLFYDESSASTRFVVVLPLQ